MSFSFNFQLQDDIETSEDVQETKELDSPLAKRKKANSPSQDCLKPAERIYVQENQMEVIRKDRENVQALQLENGSFLFYKQAIDMVDEIVSESNKSTKCNEGSSHSADLVPNVYEGGLKVWECSVDLVQYLSCEDIAWRGLNVAEIGCGSGLPGLYAYIQGANVTFTDYNKEVLQEATIPNVILNDDNEDNQNRSSISSKCEFWAGDWSYVQENLDKKYDIILTSETIYNPDNYKKLYNILKKLLKDSGKIYIAAKTYYFGVGGGTRDFENLVTKLGEFSIKAVKLFEEGVQREILLMERIES